MSLLSWFSDLFSKRGKSSALYQRGMKRAHAEDLAGAIVDYTAVIDDPAAPADLKAMALFNRALVHSKQKNYDDANADLERVLTIAETPANLKEATRQKLERIRKRSKE